MHLQQATRIRCHKNRRSGVFDRLHFPFKYFHHCLVLDQVVNADRAAAFTGSRQFNHSGGQAANNSTADESTIIQLENELGITLFRLQNGK
jgi:hypothetical protein